MVTVIDRDAPGLIVPLSKVWSVAVAVWAVESWLIQVIFVLAWIVIVVGV